MSPEPIALRFENGIYVICRSALPQQLREILARAEKADAMVREHLDKAEFYRRNGQPEILATLRDTLAESWRIRRDLLVRQLWIMVNDRPPPGLTFERVKIME